MSEIVAQRRFVARLRNRRARPVVVRFGRPVHSSIKRDPWWCPVEIVGLGKPRFLPGTKETYVILEAKGTTSSLKLRNEDGRERVVGP